MKYYTIRKEYLISKYTDIITYLDAVIKFIKLVISEKIIINKMPKKKIIEQIKKYELPIKDSDESYGYLTGLSIIRFSKEEIDKHRTKVDTYKKELEIIVERSIEDFYWWIKAPQDDSCR